MFPHCSSIMPHLFLKTISRTPNYTNCTTGMKIVQFTSSYVTQIWTGLPALDGSALVRRGQYLQKNIYSGIMFVFWGEVSGRWMRPLGAKMHVDVKQAISLLLSVCSKSSPCNTALSSRHCLQVQLPIPQQYLPSPSLLMHMTSGMKFT